MSDPKWLTVEVLDRVKRPDLYQSWDKAWGGTLSHFWLSDRRALCGKELTRQSSRWYYAGAKKPCEVCKKRAAIAKERVADD